MHFWTLYLVQCLRSPNNEGNKNWSKDAAEALTLTDCEKNPTWLEMFLCAAVVTSLKIQQAKKSKFFLTTDLEIIKHFYMEILWKTIELIHQNFSEIGLLNFFLYRLPKIISHWKTGEIFIHLQIPMKSNYRYFKRVEILTLYGLNHVWVES